MDSGPKPNLAYEYHFLWTSINSNEEFFQPTVAALYYRSLKLSDLGYPTGLGELPRYPFFVHLCNSVWIHNTPVNTGRLCCRLLAFSRKLEALLHPLSRPSLVLSAKYWRVAQDHLYILSEFSNIVISASRHSSASYCLLRRKHISEWCRRSLASRL
jgi:hypothetical protein